jgi:hypothetical protein
MRVIAAPAGPDPSWAIPFCAKYTPFLFPAGKWMIGAGILLGITLAVADIFVKIRAHGSARGGNRADAAAPTAVLDAIKGFIHALASAPNWFASSGAGCFCCGWLAMPCPVSASGRRRAVRHAERQPDDASRRRRRQSLLGVPGLRWRVI